MGAQAYTDHGDDGIYTTDASWLAYRLCAEVETVDERNAREPEFAPGMRDENVGAAAATVIRAHNKWPIRFSVWVGTPQASEWTGRRGPYNRLDWISARRFIARCARRGVGFHVSY